MSLQDEINKRIKEEITTDPEKLGYAGKTDEEIMKLLNDPIQVTTTTISFSPSPMNRILAGLASAPNAIVDKTEVTTAKAAIIK
jgi:hypothetical protein